MNNTQTLTELATEIASARENTGFDNYVSLIEEALATAKLQGFKECADLVCDRTNRFTSDLGDTLRHIGWKARE